MKSNNPILRDISNASLNDKKPCQLLHFIYENAYVYNNSKIPLILSQFA